MSMELWFTKKIATVIQVQTKYNDIIRCMQTEYDRTRKTLTQVSQVYRKND